MIFFKKTEKEARLRYCDGDFDIIIPGDFVVCSLTGEPIPLSELRYWSVENQEAYKDAESSLSRELERNPKWKIKTQSQS